MRIKKFNEDLDSDINIIKDILLDLKDEFQDIEIKVSDTTIDGIIDVISIFIISRHIINQKNDMDTFKLINKFQTNLLDCLLRIEEALNAKVVLIPSFKVKNSLTHDIGGIFARTNEMIDYSTITWPERFLVKKLNK